MELKPHLTFHTPEISDQLDKLTGYRPKIHTPPIASQFGRFKAKLSSLKTRFAEHITLTDSVEGLSPERILVFEIAGSIKDFATALRKIEGFEYLSHWMTDEDIEQESIYSIKDNGEKAPLKREFYLTMSNQRGLQKLYSEWEKVSSTGSSTYGLTPLQHALKQLQDIRFWDARDRIKNTGLLEDWKYRLSEVEQYGAESIPFEIELWFRRTPDQRVRSEFELKKVVTSLGGKVTGAYVHTGIEYHALRGELPIDQVEAVLDKGAEHLQLMRAEQVMYFRPLGQCGFNLTKDSLNDVLEEDIDSAKFQGAASEAVIALFDGLPLENHQAIANRVFIDDPDNYSDLYQVASDQLHGTAMASLIIHGDKNANESALESPLYVRPILAPGTPNINDKRLECIPEGVLPLDLVHRAVKRMFEGENEEAPVAPNIKAINLSVCDPNQLFERNMSPWARMLDWLSNKYNVLFIVSAGNHSKELKLKVKQKEFNSMDDLEKEEAIIQHINNSRWERRMMSPAEAINAITVKAAHHDYSDVKESFDIVDPFKTNGMFSPINPLTLGKANAIKPEIMFSGGRVTYRNFNINDNDPVSLSVINTPKAFGPGHMVAVPSPNPGSINSYAYSYGTSNATALTTRRIGMLHETIKSMKEFQDDDALDHASDSLILKALLVHGAELPEEAKEACERMLKTDKNRKTFKREEALFFGFGNVNESRIHGCGPNQATLIRTGELELGHSEIYKFPLPQCLSSSIEKRRMIITLAWFSPINPSHQEYRQAQMWVSNPKNLRPLLFDKRDYYYSSQKKGTIYHDVVHGSDADPFIEGEEISLKVNCKARAGANTLKVPYALVVTLDSPNVELNIYEEVKQALEQRLTQKTASLLAGDL